MISRAARRTSSDLESGVVLSPPISAFNFSRIRSDAGILSIEVRWRPGCQTEPRSE